MAQKDKKRNYRSNGNREYKSDVISMMLQIPEYALDVYNAMNVNTDGLEHSARSFRADLPLV